MRVLRLMVYVLAIFGGATLYERLRQRRGARAVPAEGEAPTITDAELVATGSGIADLDPGPPLADRR